MPNRERYVRTCAFPAAVSLRIAASSHLTVRGSGPGCFQASFPCRARVGEHSLSSRGARKWRWVLPDVIPLSCLGRGAQFIISRCEEAALGASRRHSPVVPGSQELTGTVPSLFSTEFSFTIILESKQEPTGPSRRFSPQNSASRSSWSRNKSQRAPSRRFSLWNPASI